MSDHAVTRCECGATEVVCTPGMVMTKLRCPLCSPEKPKPVLRLVKP